jgi:hypothetical protein
VSSADYLVSLKDGYSLSDTIISKDEFQKAFEEFYAKQDITINKKTKKSETVVDIKPMITLVSFDEKEYADSLRECLVDVSGTVNNESYYFHNTESKADVYENNIRVFMQLDTGSVANLKPELVMEAFCNEKNISYNPYAWQVHRLEIYKRDEMTMKLIPLDRLEM